VLENNLSRTKFLMSVTNIIFCKYCIAYSIFTVGTIYVVTRLNEDKYNSFLLWLSKNRHTQLKKKFPCQYFGQQTLKGYTINKLTSIQIFSIFIKMISK
jgi:hypothetical protein